MTGLLVALGDALFALAARRVGGAAWLLGVPLIVIIAVVVATLEAGSSWLLGRARRLLGPSAATEDAVAAHQTLVRRHAVAVAVVLVGLVGVAGLYVLLVRFSTVTDDRMRTVLSVGAAVAAAGLTWVGTLLVRPFVERGVAAFDRRFGLPWPRSPQLRRLLGVVLPVVVLTVPLLALYSPALGRARFFLWLVLFLLAERVVFGLARRRVEARLGRAALSLLGGALITSALTAAIWLERSANAAGELGEMPVARASLAALRTLTDVDRDGYSALLGGGDCDAFDDEIQPLARDVPANGVDENCDGADAKPPAVGFRPARTRFGGLTELGARPRKLNIVWFLIDSMRADHTSLLGYRKRTTPYLEAFAADALVFERAYSQGAATMLSTQSMMTGRDPGSLEFEGQGWLQVAPSQQLFAERASELGYSTLLVSLGAMSTRLPSLHRGFREVAEPGDRRREHPILKLGGLKAPWNHRTTAVASVYGIQLVERQLERENQPFFLMVYSNEPHEPYLRHAEGFPDFGSDDVGRYDSEIAFADRHLGFFIDYLRYRKDLWENTIVVITSDHGEEFGEHGKRFHGSNCHRQAVHVPLLVRIPGVPAGRVRTPVALVDIVPTLLEAIGAEPGKMRLDGQSLLIPSLAPEAVDPERPIFCTAMPLSPVDQPWFYRSVRTQRSSYVRDLLHGKDALYDAEADFAETRNLLGEAPERRLVARLREQAVTSLTGNLVERFPR